MSYRRLAAAVVTALLFGSCLRPSEDRAERDQSVGQAASASLRVEIEQGLAAVRSLTSHQLTLWGSAPSFVVALHAEASQTLDLEIQNCLPDAKLVPLSGAGRALAQDDSDVPTRKHFQLELAAGDTRLALAAPDADGDAAFQFGLLSDIQEAIDHVQDIYDKLNAQPDVRFVVGAGDLTSAGTREQLERFQSELLHLKVPYFATLGNHELGTSPDLFHDYFGRGNLHFRFHDVAFTLLDDGSASIDPLVYDWLDGWLADAKRDVHVVAMHIPPLDPIGVRNGCMASRSEAAKLLGRLAEGRVDVTLYGHIHSYYEFDNAGIPAFISGGGGAIPERFDGIGRHFMLFTADPKRGITAHEVVRVD
ncbi:MAG TPA: metallophosphoesterase [Polyangiaceae bacterium]|nr:metallophosphoesterase [Polyangiaceae bacterium]